MTNENEYYVGCCVCGRILAKGYSGSSGVIRCPACRTDICFGIDDDYVSSIVIDEPEAFWGARA